MASSVIPMSSLRSTDAKASDEPLYASRRGKPDSGGMKQATLEQEKAARSERWRERIAQQERSGFSVQDFCKEQGVTEQSFYAWRKRLRNEQPARFALVETGSAQRQPGTEGGLELILPRGERLRISAGVDATVLRTVLEVLRA